MLGFFKRSVPSGVVIQDASEIIPAAMGNDLKGLILHGGLAEPSADLGDSASVQLFVVLDHIDGELMGRLANAYRNVRGYRQIVPMVLTERELHASTDVFPITFLEMQRCYKLLAGDDVLADLSINSNHLRLRCEQELKNLLLRMQSTFLASHDHARTLQDAMNRNYNSLLRTIRATLFLLGEKQSSSPVETLLHAAELLSLDAEAVRRISELAPKKRSEVKLPSDAMTSVYAAFINLVAEATQAVDQLPETASLVSVSDVPEDES